MPCVTWVTSGMDGNMGANDMGVIVHWLTLCSGFVGGFGCPHQLGAYPRLC